VDGPVAYDGGGDMGGYVSEPRPASRSESEMPPVSLCGTVLFAMVWFWAL
jgi:hypothetical protein